MRQMNKFTPTWMEPKVIRSISDAALSMASSALSSIGGSCHTKGKHAQVDPYFDIPIRLLPRFITVRKEIRAVSDETPLSRELSQLSQQSQLSPSLVSTTWRGRTEARRMGYLSSALPFILSQRREEV